MIDTEMTRKAYEIAKNAHKGQRDLGGTDYINHPVTVAEQMTDEASTIVALLHDVLEDTKVSVQDLRREGFSWYIIDALQCLNHSKGTDYMEYIRNLSTNPIARKVKKADLKHNMDTTRLSEITEKDMERVRKYEKAYELLGDD